MTARLGMSEVGRMSPLGKGLVLMAAGGLVTLVVCAGLVIGRANPLGEDALFY